MATIRTGSFGSYWGSLKGESEPLSITEMKLNAFYIRNYLANAKWSINALLGNLQAESTINPGRWQSDDPGNTSLGYGLVQWTPSTKYTNWCTEQGLTDPSTMDNNLKRILYELENNIQWIATNSYDMSFKDFSTSTHSVSVLAKAFLLNYERPTDQSTTVQAYRAELAVAWYEVLTGESPPDTPESSGKFTESKRRRFNLLFNAQRRRNQWIKKL